MAENAKASIGADDVGSDQFTNIQRAETGRIKERRKKLKRGGDPIEPQGKATVYETTGLALSGGGVRSAAFALGALQALDHHDVMRKIDYLSTVSGGGYMGSSLSATMTASEGKFVFRGEERSAPKDTPVTSEISDTEAVGHIRNYSNYLIPGGMRDIMTGAAILLRGLVANAALVLPLILLLAAVTIWSNPYRSLLSTPDLFGISLERFIPVSNFGVTLALALFGFALFLWWALYRSRLSADRLSEFRTKWPFVGAGFLGLLAFSFFCELQPFVVAGMFDIADGEGFWGSVTGLVKWLATITAPIAAAATLFRQQLGALVSTDNASTGLAAKALVPFGKIAIWLAGLALPLLIWVLYLYLCYWGIINNQIADCEGCVSGEHTPKWLLTASEWTSYFVLGYVIDRPMALLYTVFGGLLFALSWCLRPNANSLHRLYRDRLGKAFLFDPTKRSERGVVTRGAPSIDQKRDFVSLDGMVLSKISTVDAPYHLINAALNIQGSDYANRRGRNADFFLMSPLFVGSQATGYAPTHLVEASSRDLDLATAMAISGAAASSNMGAKSIRPLTATFAILNVRLGYWLKNPRYIDGESGSGGRRRARRWSVRNASLLFLWSEITGRLYENSNEIYLTDGGHIENLGIFELLRRRCRVILCIDAEADPDMNFSSFVTLQRYARIDLGVRIDMPWDKIRGATLASMKSGAAQKGEPPAPAHGPHAAIGVIDYGRGEKGYLVYVKSSVTGDENDYVRDYGRRHRQFPHETTGDQFFSEEQFEVYRSLAFHAVHKMFDGADGVEVGQPGKLENFRQSEDETVKAVRNVLI